MTLNSELQLQPPPKHKPSRNLQYLLTNFRLLAQKTKNFEYHQCLGRKLCPSLERGTTIKQITMNPANVTGGNTHQPGAWGASHYHQKHLCTLPISPFLAVANSRCFRGRQKSKQTQRLSYAWKSGGVGNQRKTLLTPLLMPHEEALEQTAETWCSEQNEESFPSQRKNHHLKDTREKWQLQTHTSKAGKILRPLKWITKLSNFIWAKILSSTYLSSSLHLFLNKRSLVLEMSSWDVLILIGKWKVLICPCRCIILNS